MAASVTTFCKISSSSGFGVKKVNQQYLANTYGHNNIILTRNLSVLPRMTPAYLDKMRASGGISRSKIEIHDQHRLEQFILKSKGDNVNAPTEDEVSTLNYLKEDNFNGSVSLKVEKQEEELSRATLLWRAAKIPLYTVALIPVTVASAAAYWQSGIFSWGRYFGMLASFVIINMWIKLSNDVYDFDTGADKDKKESVVNLFGSRDGINIIAWSLLAIGFAGLSGIAIAAKSARSIVLLAASVFCFYLYQCPPFRMSYYGVGEPLLFAAFGPISTIGYYLLHSTGSGLPITSTITWLSIVVGITTAIILFCSHFHQIEGDKAVGKMSPLVRLGTEKASHVLTWSVMGLYLVMFALGSANVIPFASTVLGTMTIPVGVSLVDFVQKNHTDKSKIFMAKYYVVMLHTILGFALSAGLVVARMFAKQIPLVV